MYVYIIKKENINTYISKRVTHQTKECNVRGELGSLELVLCSLK